MTHNILTTENKKRIKNLINKISNILKTLMMLEIGSYYGIGVQIKEKAQLSYNFLFDVITQEKNLI